MMRYVLSLAFIILGITIASHATTATADEFSENGWDLESSISPIDDSEEVVLTKTSEVMADGKTLKLSLACREKETHAWVYFGGEHRMVSDGLGVTPSLTYRVDKQKAVRALFDTSSDHTVLGLWFDNKSIPFLKQLATGSRLYVEAVPINENSVGAFFDLAGVGAAVDYVAAACDWTVQPIDPSTAAGIRAALAQQLARCPIAWPVGAKEDDVVVRLSVRFNKDGTVAGTPEPSSSAMTEMERAATSAVKRGILRCGPIQMDPAEYSVWREVDAVFPAGSPPRKVEDVNSPDPAGDALLIQTALHNLGYSPGPIDGVPGSKTSEALKSWQSANGHQANGFLSLAAYDELLRLGMPSVAAALDMQLPSEFEGMRSSLTARAFALNGAGCAIERVTIPKITGMVAYLENSSGARAVAEITQFGIDIAIMRIVASTDAATIGDIFRFGPSGASFERPSTGVKLDLIEC